MKVAWLDDHDVILGLNFLRKAEIIVVPHFNGLQRRRSILVLPLAFFYKRGEDEGCN